MVAGIHSSYALKFAVVIWTTQPYYGDASGKASDYDFAVRNGNTDICTISI